MSIVVTLKLIWLDTNDAGIGDVRLSRCSGKLVVVVVVVVVVAFTLAVVVVAGRLSGPKSLLNHWKHRANCADN